MSNIHFTVDKRAVNVHCAVSLGLLSAPEITLGSQKKKTGGYPKCPLQREGPTVYWVGK